MRLGHETVHWCLGPTIEEALIHSNPSDAIIDLRKAKPINSDMLQSFSKTYSKWVIWEDAQSIGGVGSQLASWIAENNPNIQLIPQGYKDQFIGHGDSTELKKQNRPKI